MVDSTPPDSPLKSDAPKSGDSTPPDSPDAPKSGDARSPVKLTVHADNSFHFKGEKTRKSPLRIQNLLSEVGVMFVEMISKELSSKERWSDDLARDLLKPDMREELESAEFLKIRRGEDIDGLRYMYIYTRFNGTVEVVDSQMKSDMIAVFCGCKNLEVLDFRGEGAIDKKFILQEDLYDSDDEAYFADYVARKYPYGTIFEENAAADPDPVNDGGEQNQHEDHGEQNQHEDHYIDEGNQLFMADEYDSEDSQNPRLSGLESLGDSGVYEEGRRDRRDDSDDSDAGS